MPDIQGSPIRVKVKSLLIYKERELAIILLEDLEGAWGLPILAKALEVTSIALSLTGEEPPRPLSHDLLARLIERFNARLRHVLLDVLEGPVCHGIITVSVEGRELDFDARPSDAIALALRAKVPLYVSPGVVGQGAFRFDRDDWAKGLEEKTKLQN